jgi:membrane protein involved in colicin uptake
VSSPARSSTLLEAHQHAGQIEQATLGQKNTQIYARVCVLRSKPQFICVKISGCVKKPAENARKNAENARKNAENMRKNAENARKNAENARKNAENVRKCRKHTWIRSKRA